MNIEGKKAYTIVHHRKDQYEREDSSNQHCIKKTMQ